MAKGGAHPGWLANPGSNFMILLSIFIVIKSTTSHQIQHHQDHHHCSHRHPRPHEVREIFVLLTTQLEFMENLDNFEV